MLQRRILIALMIVFTLAFSASASAVMTHDEMKIYAVTTDGQGLSATLKIDIEPGDGQVWSGVSSLVGTTTQDAERTAVNLARNYSKDAMNYDYKFDIESEASVVDGPSAGAAMALLVIAMLQDKDLPDAVSITGTISKEGFVGPVGGVFEKSKEAARIGIELFMIPKGEARQTIKEGTELKSVNLTEYMPGKHGIYVIEVADIDEAIRFAFSDIEKIDITVPADANVPDFIPQPINYSQKLEPMHRLTVDYISESKEMVKSGRNALSTTLINDSGVLTQLSEILTTAEKEIDAAQISLDQNYLYTAANDAFLAWVFSSMVRDLASNPSMLEADSTGFDAKIKALQEQIDDLESEMDEYVPLENIEYYISAQQRLTYAKYNLQKINDSRSVVITINGVPTSDTTQVELIQDYEFALGWYKIASDLYDISKNSEHRLKPRDDAFKDYMTNFIIESENGLTAISEDSKEDIKRRIESAKIEKNERWYIASSFDAAAALALINGELVSKDQDYNSLYSILEKQISDLDKNFLESKHQFVWAQLYLDHAKNSLEEANYYAGMGEGARTISALKNGISLAFLAEYIYIVSEDMYTHLDSLGPEAYMKSGSNGNGTAGQQIPIENNTIMLAVIFSGICVVLIFVLLGFIFKFKRQLGKNLSISSEMHNIQSMMNAIEKSYLSGKIDREQRDAILAQYREELAQLENLKKDQSQHILSIDGSRTEISDYEQRLKNLKDYLKSGVISRADYDAKSVQYQTRINELKAAIQRDESGISENKQKLTSIIEEDEEIRGQVKKVSRSRNIPKNRTKSAVPASKGKFASRKDKK